MKKQLMVCLPIDPPLSIGSGSPYAYGVLETGKKNLAQAAVRAAIKLDINSGGDLQIWKMPEVPATPSVRPPAPVPEVKLPTDTIGDFTLSALTEFIDSRIKESVAPAPGDDVKPEPSHIPQAIH